MTADNWISVLQLLVAIAAVSIAVVTISQKTKADGRAEWWKRYTWATERIAPSASSEDFDLGVFHLEVLSTTALATTTEKQIIQDLVIRYLIWDDGTHSDHPDETEEVDHDGNGSQN